VEEDFSRLRGVISTSVGYTGGSLVNPTYAQVCRGDTGHTEVVEVVYDPDRIPFERLLTAFWAEQDPTRPQKAQYRSAIFYTTPTQAREAQASRTALSLVLRRPVHTEILPASPYYLAEDYHQQYVAKRKRKMGS
jgi:peptide-methionine (S)-S-oxide reductase